MAVCMSHAAPESPQAVAADNNVLVESMDEKKPLTLGGVSGKSESYNIACASHGITQQEQV
jgi:hypothetical protein